MLLLRSALHVTGQHYFSCMQPLSAKNHVALLVLHMCCVLCASHCKRLRLQTCFVAVQEAPIYTFVAIVPVTMDALFKYWIFKGLNRKNPAAAVTLKNMDRH